MRMQKDLLPKGILHEGLKYEKGMGVIMDQLYDIIRQNQELWDLYTRKEEYTSQRRDRYDCFRYAYSTHQEVRKPLVSRYLLDHGYKIEYPNNSSFAVCLTHDVDEIYPPPIHSLLSSISCIRNLDFDRFKNQLFWKFRDKVKSPYWNFNEIMELEEKYGAKSTFFFIATNVDIRRFRYNIEDLKSELGSIVDKGWEVGLHGGYYAFNNLGEILREKDRLEKVLGRKVTGYRNHYLRFKVPDSWKLLAQAEFKYDTTLGYQDTVGFRNGMCHPFRPVDISNDEVVPLDIMEIPLILMDGTLFNSFKNFNDAWEITKILIDTVESSKGVLTINWHSNNFNCPFKEEWSKLYKMILEYCYAKNAWMTTGDAIYHHYIGRL
ncbi:MAG: polysaccharide deacetylase family protein [Methanoregula sp.]|uniref:polysaccharide deacetylase family protein n=1 Tax=Methanoregula sp. TaxID=2052170 RepID=UPI003D0E3916